jgi:hypothetical protein
VRTNPKYFGPSAIDPRLAANSLFWKILPISPLDPRFCADQGRHPLRNSNGIKTLPKAVKKNRGAVPPSATPNRYMAPARISSIESRCC